MNALLIVIFTSFLFPFEPNFVAYPSIPERQCKSSYNSMLNAFEDTSIKCKEDLVLEKIYGLPEVKEKDHFIDSLTNHKHGISMIILQRPSKNDPYYVVQVGYNNEVRFETYFTFYVCEKNYTIKYYDPIPGKTITLKEWRNKRN